MRVDILLVVLRIEAQLALRHMNGKFIVMDTFVWINSEFIKKVLNWRYRKFIHGWYSIKIHFYSFLKCHEPLSYRQYTSHMIERRFPVGIEPTCYEPFVYRIHATETVFWSFEESITWYEIKQRHIHFLEFQIQRKILKIIVRSVIRVKNYKTNIEPFYS